LRKQIVVSIIGARPQFIKSAPLCRELARQESIDHWILHTGQHYDYRMSRIFFDELGIPAPAWNLEVGSGPHGAQTGEMLRRIEEVLLRERPGVVLVYGDTNSTAAGALAAAKLGIPVIHLEAGLRSYRKSMPEEINRVIADHVSSVLLCPTINAVNNLRREGFPGALEEGRLWGDGPGTIREALLSPSVDAPLVVNVGDVMLDALNLGLALAEERPSPLDRFGLVREEYCLATVHRAENTDDPIRLASIVEALTECGQRVLFPAHPRTAKAMRDAGIRIGGKVLMTEPLGYFDMLLLERAAASVMTDSGGVQKEAYFLGVPCVTLREETEWVETLADGRNRLAGTGKRGIQIALREAGEIGRFVPGDAFGRGDTASRIAALVKTIL
jgi:UDP-N-acetylglucosamine 2-epimerase